MREVEKFSLSFPLPGISMTTYFPENSITMGKASNQKPGILGPNIDLKEIFNSSKELPIAIGTTLSNESLIVDLNSLENILVTMVNEEFNSAWIKWIIASILDLKQPNELKLVLIEIIKKGQSSNSLFNKQFLTEFAGKIDPAINSVKSFKKTIESLNLELEMRYELLAKTKTKNIREYNVKVSQGRFSPKKGFLSLPHIVVILNEFSDLQLSLIKKFTVPILRLAQLSGSVGIYIILTTNCQTIINEVVSVNFPSLITFQLVK